MSDQRVFKFGELKFADGTIVSVPPIAASGNGWVYKPNQLRTKQEIASGRNRSWPRGSGFGPAEEWMQEYFERQITSRNWEVPTSIEKTINDSIGVRSSTDTLAVEFHQEPWGWINLSIEVQRTRDNYGRVIVTEGETRKIEYRLSMHELGIWYLKKQVGDVHAPWANGSWAYINHVIEVPLDDVRDYVLAWIKNPWDRTAEMIRQLQYITQSQLDEIIHPPKLANLKYDADHTTSEDETVTTFSMGKLRFYQKGEVKNVMTNDVAWDELAKILDVYRFLGYDIRVEHGYVQGVAGDTIQSITIEVPASEHDNELGHRIHLDAQRGTIRFVCGYVEDEDRWVDRQSRLAKHHMAQLEEDLFTEFTIETKPERKDQ